MNNLVHKPNSRRKINVIINDIIETLKRKKKMSIAELATKYGYAYGYFKYHILPGVLVHKCIEKNKDYVYWVCGK